MRTLWGGQSSRRCEGVARRNFLKASFLQGTGFSLTPSLHTTGRAADISTSAQSVVLFWLDGGLSHFESYDPKPHAFSEYRGPFGVAQTSVPGIQISDMLPGHARLMDRFAVLRSLHHECGEHWSGPHAMLTGHCGPTFQNPLQTHPSAGAIVARTRGPNRPDMLPYVAVPFAFHSFQQMVPGYHSGTYLGASYNPFSVIRECPTYQLTGQELHPQSLSLAAEVSLSRFQSRRELLQGLDDFRRHVDASTVMEDTETYTKQALAITAGSACRRAFDIDQEDPRLRDRYGRNYLGQSALLARRLVEAGASFVTVCHRDWDHHEQLETLLRHDLPRLDHAVCSLFEDLQQRGLLEQTLVLVMGEFGRTPKINKNAGRDHWPHAGSVLIGGGGVTGGQIVGATNSNGEHPVTRPLAPADIWATVYHQLGIDLATQYKDRAGRPIPITDGAVIRELV